MKIIYKYQLHLGRTRLVIPGKAQLLKVGGQGPELCAWFLLDLNEEFAERHFEVIATGQSVGESPGEYVDTIFQDGLVWHVFEQAGK